MLVSASDVTKFAAEPFDVAIIGAGIAGLFCAVQLERNNFRVALIEGGDVTPDTLSNASHTSIAGRPHSTVESGRAMGLGGTGLLWGGQLAELGIRDVEGEKASWPISYAELHTLYDRVYAALGLLPRCDNASARALFGSDEGIVDEIERIFTYWLPNPNIAGLFRDTLVRSSRLKVFVRCKAVGLSFDESGHATSVRVRTLSGLATIAANRFVIAGGVVESVRLVLAAQRQENCPWRDNFRIGASFQDHIGGEFGTLAIKNERLFRDRFETGFNRKTKYMPKLRYTGGVEGQEKPLSVCAFPVFHSDLGEHVANIKLLLKAIRSGASYGKWQNLPASVVKIGAAFLPLIRRYVRERRILAMMDRGVSLAFQCEQIPRLDSRITLTDQAEAADGLPAVSIDWRTGTGEPKFLRASALRFADYFHHTGCAVLHVDPLLLDDAPSFVARLGDTSHPSGGLCMSSNPAEGATDTDGRLWGASNVYATGASVVPTSGEANITLTGLALALRLADHLAASRG